MSNFPLFTPFLHQNAFGSAVCETFVRHPRLLLLGMDFHPAVPLPFLTGKVGLGISFCSLERISYSHSASRSLFIRRGNNISFVFHVYWTHSYCKALSPFPNSPEQDHHLVHTRGEEPICKETLARPFPEVFSCVKT